MESPGAAALVRSRPIFKWMSLVSVPILVVLHAPLLPSEALPHRMYHAMETLFGAGFPVLVHASFVTPAVALVGFVTATVMARKR